MSAPVNEQTRKILVVRLSSLGDLIHTLPAVQALGSRFPRLSIHWLTSPPYRSFLEAADNIDKVWTIDFKKRTSGIRGIFATIRMLRKEHFDSVLDFQGLIKSALPARLVCGRSTFGPGTAQAREKAASWFYTDRIQINQVRLHQIEYHLALAFGGDTGIRPDPAIRLKIEDEKTKRIDRELSRRRLVRPVLLNPGGGWSTKRWAIERFARLSRMIQTELQVPTLLTYGPGEEDLIGKIKELEPDFACFFPTDILELAYLCRQSRLMVAGDTGPMHLAVAMKTPVVAILGPALAWRTGPYGSRNLSVTHSTPCPHPYRRKCRDHFCMDIPVSEVFAKVKQILYG